METMKKEMKEITLEEVANNLKIREGRELVGEDFYIEIPKPLHYWNHPKEKKDRDKLVCYSVEIHIPEEIEEPDEIAQAFEDCMNLDNRQYREICHDLQRDYNDLVRQENSVTWSWEEDDE